MMKYVIVVLALISVAAAQLLFGGPASLTGPSFHGPFAHSYDSGIRRYGSTAGYAYAAAPAYVDAGYGAYY